MSHLIRPNALASLSALAALALLWAHPVQAQDIYPCDGAGPGEVIIDMEPNGPDLPDTPICQYIGEDGGGNDGYWVDQYTTLVWGTDQTGAPTYSWYANASSQSEADTGALAQCQSSGFTNCEIATNVVNGAIAIAVDKSGTLHSDYGKDPRDAKRKALKFCKSQGGKGCQIQNVLDSPAAWVGN